ncbi:MAG: ABC transporter permease, partial [Deinococcus sp.]|nr:ABC transporter permease [Deinococcus sp.]
MSAVRTAPSPLRLFSEAHYVLRRNPTTLAGLLVVLFMALAGLLAPVLAPRGPVQKDFAHVSQPPSAQFPMGTD